MKRDKQEQRSYKTFDDVCEAYDIYKRIDVMLMRVAEIQELFESF